MSKFWEHVYPWKGKKDSTAEKYSAIPCREEMWCYFHLGSTCTTSFKNLSKISKFGDCVDCWNLELMQNVSQLRALPITRITCLYWNSYPKCCAPLKMSESSFIFFSIFQFPLKKSTPKSAMSRSMHKRWWVGFEHWLIQTYWILRMTTEKRVQT